VSVPGIAHASIALALVFAARPAIFAVLQTHVGLVVLPTSAVAAALHIVVATVAAAPHIHLVVSLLLVSRNRQLALGLVKQSVLVLEMAVSLPPLLAASVVQAAHHPLKEDLVVLVGA
jgi:hypothetical protein